MIKEELKDILPGHEIINMIKLINERYVIVTSNAEEEIEYVIIHVDDGECEIIHPIRLYDTFRMKKIEADEDTYDKLGTVPHLKVSEGEACIISCTECLFTISLPIIEVGEGMYEPALNLDETNRLIIHHMSHNMPS